MPGKSYGQRSLVGYSPWGHKESDPTPQLSKKKTQANQSTETHRRLLRGHAWGTQSCLCDGADGPLPRAITAPAARTQQLALGPGPLSLLLLSSQGRGLSTMLALKKATFPLNPWKTFFFFYFFSSNHFVTEALQVCER